MLAEVLSPRLGVYGAQIDRNTNTLTIQYNPDCFSLDQAKALAHDVGLALGGGVRHCILDLPDMGRAEHAEVLEKRLEQIPGVARAAINPLSRIVTVEYLEGTEVTNTDIITRLQEWGYRTREIGLPAGWWDRHRLALYTITTAVTLLAAWLLQRAGASPVLVTMLVAFGYLAGGGFAARNGLRALRQGQIDVDTLMVTAALGAAAIGQWIEGGHPALPLCPEQRAGALCLGSHAPGHSRLDGPAPGAGPRAAR